MKIILFDDNLTSDLYPIALTRPVADIRIGILTIREKWEKVLEQEVEVFTREYLQVKFPFNGSTDNAIFINAALCPDSSIIEDLKNLELNEALFFEERLIAVKTTGNKHPENNNAYNKTELSHLETSLLRYPWDIFGNNDAELRKDFQLLTNGRTSQPLDRTNTVLGDHIFVEEGATVSCSILNSNEGPIYIGKDAEIMENSVVRGPLAMLEGSVLKLNTKIYGATTIGPYSKVGGEINNSILTGYSNKGHDGFLGNSVLGEWCNLGADTNNSNLKNNYGTVKAYNYTTADYISTGLQFCGLIMGDHSKSGINTMFNTGTVVGVNANIFGGGFPEKYIPSFSWGGADGFVPFKIDKAKEVAERMMERRKVPFTEADYQIFEYLNKG